MTIRDWFITPPAPDDAAYRGSPRRHVAASADSWRPPPAAPAAAVRAVAVLGRVGEVESWAAALALALLRRADERAAVVALVGAEHEPAAAAGGTPAARRLAARLRAHGMTAAERGRLAWVRLGAGELHAAQRAAGVGAPAVLGVTAPLTAALEAMLAELDLAVLVTAEPDGPLAALAAATMDAIGVPLVSARPLPRGPARALARAGLATPRAARELLGPAEGAR